MNTASKRWRWLSVLSAAVLAVAGMAALPGHADAATSDPGQFQTYSIGTNGDLFQNTWTSSSGWSGFKDMGNPGSALTGTPAVTYDATTLEYHLFMVGSNGDVYQDWFSPGGAQNWDDLAPNGGFQTSGGGVGAMFVNGDFQVFSIASDGALFQDTYTTGWSGFTDLGMAGDGTSLTGTPAATYDSSSGDFHLFMVGTNGDVYQDWFSPGSSQNWDNLAPNGGFQTSGGGVGAMFVNGDFQVFSIASDGALFQDTYTTGWSGFTDLGKAGDGTSLTGTPAATYDSSSGDFHLFMVGSNGNVYQDWFQPGDAQNWDNLATGGFQGGVGAAYTIPVVPTYQLPVDSASTPDPGVLLYQNQYYAFSTGGFGLWESTAPAAAGPWTEVNDSGSTGNAAGDVMVHSNLPSWIDQTQGVWAPDMIQTTTGEFVVYFTAQLANIPSSNPAGNDSEPEAGSRCIGSAESTSPTGPFTVDQNPVVCLTGYNAADDMLPNQGTRVLGEGVIDGDATYVTVSGTQELVLLYKTQAGNGDSTIRMVQLSASNGTSAVGSSQQLVSAIPTDDGSYVYADTIEAPTLVQSGSWYILMVAQGNYTTCNYTTEWFKSQNIWSWSSTGGTTLLSQSTTSGLCGPASATISGSNVSGQYTIFFHGWVMNDTNGVPASGQSNATREMYADTLTFGSNGDQPMVSPIAPSS